MSRPPRAFTLIETVVSIAVLSIVMSALMSALLLASHAVPGADDPSRLAAEGDAALEFIMSDAMLATEIAWKSGSLKLVLPPRAGSGQIDTVRYTLGEPDKPPTSLERSVDAGKPRVILGRVQAFNATIVSFEGRSRLLILDLVAGGVARRASVDLAARPEFGS
jgi:prepilin-type N-terminal cleavage/methylation domain-containing protein